MSADDAPRLTDAAGVYKRTPADFQVSERLPFTPEGAGEHVYLHIRKTQRNTLDVQRSLAQLAAVPRHHVGYAGLKDRFAVTTQWFSVHLPGGGAPDWSVLEGAQTAQGDHLQLLEVTRHRKKLRIGAHSGNDFSLSVDSLTGDTAALSAALQQIQQQGFPNFFGEQRFGIDHSNLKGVASFGHVRKRLSQRQQMILSAVRAALFNEVLCERLARGCWCQPMTGDLLKLDGSNSFFGPVTVDDELCARMRALDVHPTGPLAGSDEAAVTEDAAALENAVLTRHDDYRALLARVGVKPARRALRACARQLRWQQQGAELQLQFTLDRGVYATTLLRYLGDFTQGGESRHRSEPVQGSESGQGSEPVQGSKLPP